MSHYIHPVSCNNIVCNIWPYFVYWFWIIEETKKWSVIKWLVMIVEMLLKEQDVL